MMEPQSVHTIPPMAAGISSRDAALECAENGLYIGPLKHGSKNPGSLLGTGWQRKTSNDPEQVAEWFAKGRDCGVFLHVGRSGLIVFDVDHPDKLPDVLRKAIKECDPPFQATRTNAPGRGHYVFALPDEHEFSNSAGALGKEWGEIRCHNSVIVVQPTIHEKRAEGGVYRWQRTGVIPALPDYVADQLTAAGNSAGSASDEEIEAFCGEHNVGKGRSEGRELLARLIDEFHAEAVNGAARHDAMRSTLTGALYEAQDGTIPAQWAIRKLRKVYVDAVGNDRPDVSGEFQRMVRAAIPYVLANDFSPVMVRRLKGRNDMKQRLHDDPAEEESSTVSDGDVETEGRRVVLRSMADVGMEHVVWLWDGLIPLGELSLLAGRQGIGKSTIAYWLAAEITRGTLPGELLGKPRDVLIVASEDSEQHTIKPRLLAAGADVSRVSTVRVERGTDGIETAIDLVRDTTGISDVISQTGAALVIFDPLMSRLGNKDAHKESEVREVLEPLVKIAHDLNCAILPVIHLNKSASSDPLNRIMGSGAFTFVPRSVLFVHRDENGANLLGQVKSNLGPLHQGSRSYDIEPACVPNPDDPSRPFETSRVAWRDDDERDVAEVLRIEQHRSRGKSANEVAADWLEDFLMSQPGKRADFATIQAAADEDEGFSKSKLYEAKRILEKSGRLVSDRAREAGGKATWRLVRRELHLGATAAEEVS